MLQCSFCSDTLCISNHHDCHDNLGPVMKSKVSLSNLMFPIYVGISILRIPLQCVQNEMGSTGNYLQDHFFSISVHLTRSNSRTCSKSLLSNSILKSYLLSRSTCPMEQHSLHRFRWPPPCFALNTWLFLQVFGSGIQISCATAGVLVCLFILGHQGYTL